MSLDDGESVWLSFMDGLQMGTLLEIKKHDDDGGGIVCSGDGEWVRGAKSVSHMLVCMHGCNLDVVFCLRLGDDDNTWTTASIRLKVR